MHSIILAVMLVAMTQTVGANDEVQVLKTLESTRKLGFGEGRAFRPYPQWHYQLPESMLLMKQRLSAQDVPALIAIVVAGIPYEPRGTYPQRWQAADAASMGLAALCGQSVAPLLQANQAGMFKHFLLAHFQPFSRMEYFGGIAGGCSLQDVALARSATETVRVQDELARQRLQQQREVRQAEEDATRERINRNGLNMLTPDKSTLSVAEREEVFRANLKSMGLDHDHLTPEQQRMVQNMYRTMVLQQNRVLQQNSHSPN